MITVFLKKGFKLAKVSFQLNVDNSASCSGSSIFQYIHMHKAVNWCHVMLSN